MLENSPADLRQLESAELALRTTWVLGFFFSFFFYSICSSLSLSMVFESLLSLNVSLSRFVIARCCCSGWFMELPCRKSPAARKVAVLRFCLYSPSTSKMSDIGTLCARMLGYGSG